VDHLLGDQRVGVAVVHADAQVEEVPVVEQADLGALGGRVPFDGKHLDQFFEEHAPAPGVFVEDAVDHGGRVGADEGRGPLGGLGGGRDTEP
jgi:hypothetical protein